MDGDEILTVAETTASRLPTATWEHPFGPDWEVFKIGGKVFALTTQVPGEAVVTVKCDPGEGQALIGSHAEIKPGYHMNKRQWISLTAGRGMSRSLVEELVTNSYDLVASKLPRDRQPGSKS